VPHYIHVCNGFAFRVKVVAQGHCLNSSFRLPYIGGIPITILGEIKITVLCGITYVASIIYRIKHDAVNPNSMLHITKERCEWFYNIYCRPLFVGHGESKPITPLGTMDGSSS
jgi:hypothetical protein